LPATSPPLVTGDEGEGDDNWEKLIIPPPLCPSPITGEGPCASPLRFFKKLKANCLPLKAKMIRAFLAIHLPETLRAGLALVQTELKRSHADVRWVVPGNIHLTLKFFGNVPDDEIEALALAAREVAQGEAPFQLKATIAGAFPSPKAPRVVWLALGGEVVPLNRLYYHLEKAFAKLGYPAEGRAFHPHLTLGRVKSPANRERLAKMLETMPAVDWPPFEVKELILFQSVLSPKGSIYTPLQVVPLGK
jgi:RNA 2',3'-cyclic 3'-phosphodiesterase